MKYITLERSEYHLKLLYQLNVSSISAFWLYDVFEIEDDAELCQELQDVSVEIPEDIAKASIFSHINFSKRKTLNIKVEHRAFEWIKHLLDIPKNKILHPRDKFVYTLTEEDEKNSIIYLKTILLHYAKRQFDVLSEGNKLRYNKKYNRLIDSINVCERNHELHAIMYEHYGRPIQEYDDEENKTGNVKIYEKWDVIVPSRKRIMIDPVTPEHLDSGPTIDNIDPNVFELKWEIGDPIEVKL
jgi:hypothetical protein